MWHAWCLVVRFIQLGFLDVWFLPNLRGKCADAFEPYGNVFGECILILGFSSFCTFLLFLSVCIKSTLSKRFYYVAWVWFIFHTLAEM
jgi:hypothetical protein